MACIRGADYADHIGKVAKVEGPGTSAVCLSFDIWAIAGVQAGSRNRRPPPSVKAGIALIYPGPTVSGGIPLIRMMSVSSPM